MSGEATKVRGKAARKALLALKLLAAGEREDLWHPGYSKSGFVKRFLFSPFCVIRNFIKGLIDDSNGYKFIYVPSSSSSEKNTFSTSAGFLIFSSESLSQSNKSLDQRTLIFHVTAFKSASGSHVTNCCD